MTKYIFSLLLLTAILPLTAQNPGSLDTSFANQGVLLTPVSNNFCIAGNIAVQPDDKIVLVGSATSTGEKSHGVMLRYMPDGKGLDSMFGVNGRVDSYIDTVLSPVGSGMGNVMLLSNGRLLVTVAKNCLTQRFLPDGRVDSSFQGTGLTYFNPSTAGMEWIVGRSMKLQTDGKILYAGTAALGVSQRHVITVRFTSDGIPDTNFGPSHEGYVMTDLSAWGLQNPETYQVLIQSDGKIVAVGMAEGGPFGPCEFLLRYNANGTLDNTFGTSGLVTHNFSDSDQWGVGGLAALQSDDKILLAIEPQQTQVSANFDIGIVRFLSNGKTDSTYGTNGKVYKHLSFSGSTIEAGLMLPDNSLFLSAPYVDDNTQSRYPVFLHYDTNGILDPSFQYESGNCIYGFASDNYGKILGCASGVTQFSMNRFFSGLILGLASISNNVVLRLFPNPSDKIINLEYTLSRTEKITITLWNQQGQKLYRFIENQLEEVGKHTHQLSPPTYLPNGTYFIKVETSNRIFTTQWVK